MNNEGVYAQDAPGAAQALPPVTVTDTRPGVKRGRDETATRRVRAKPTVPVYPTTPLAGGDIATDKAPATSNTVDASQIAQTGSLNITDSLVKYVPGIISNDVAGNPFQPNIEFRGFVASPVSGTPQGLAVYQNGVRINEAFGDTVNWDLIPTAAIQSVTMVTNNPAFGLNALGGAVDVKMKDGFNYHGAELNIMGGSYGRVQSSAQWGQQYGDFSVYGALEGLHDDGFRNFSASNIRRFYGDIGARNDQAEFHINMGVADNDFGAAATVPAELLQQFWGATYTTPQTSSNKVAYVNLTGKVEVSPTWTIDGVAHVRIFDQNTQDGNPTGAQPCDANAGLLCFGDGVNAGQWLEWLATREPLRPERGAGGKRSNVDLYDDNGILGAGDQYRPIVWAQQPLCDRHQLRL